jgi:subtilisin family serine protease
MLKYIILTTFVLATHSAFSADSLTGLNFDKPHVANELIVKFKEGQSRSFLTRSSVEIKKEFQLSKAMLIKIPENLRSANIIDELTNSDAVEYVQLNYIYTDLFVNTPNDADFSSQYAHARISSEEAWSTTTGSRDVLVAVIDSGVDYNHPDIKDNYWTNSGEMGLDENGEDKSTNGIDDDGNGYVDDFRGWDFINGDNDPMDDNSHGTHCAGIIGASGNNSIGVVGVNWEVSMVGIKIFSARGSTNSAAIVEGVEYATLMGVSLSNNSWGGTEYEPALEAAIKEAQKAGIIFVAASGNNRADTDRRTFYPAGYKIDNVVSVLSTDSRDNKSSFSNYGSGSVHIGAPGSSILSTVPGGGYRSMSGTSMAAPYVAGAVALAMSQFPDEDHVKLINRVIHSGDKLSSLNGETRNARRLNTSAMFSTDEVAPANVSHFELVNNGWFNVTFEYDKVGDDGMEGEAQFYDIRWSEEPLTLENWGEATGLPIRDESAVSENRVEIRVRDIFGRRAFIGMRAVDEAGNVSPEIKQIEL